MYVSKVEVLSVWIKHIEDKNKKWATKEFKEQYLLNHQAAE